MAKRRKGLLQSIFEAELGGPPLPYMQTCHEEGWGACEQGFRLCLKCDTACEHDKVCPDCNPAVRAEG